MGAIATTDSATTVASSQPDFFYDSLSSNAPIKDDRVLMEYPFFSLSKNRRMKPIIYQDKGGSIKIEPGPNGIATIWDKEILVYLATIINEKIERGDPPSPVITFKASDFLKRAKRGTGKRDYDLFLDALHRLRSTTITTSIASADLRERRGFGWIDNYQIIERTTKTQKKIMSAVRVTLSPWIHNALTKERRILTLSADYFTLKKGIARRLYEIARKHCGSQDEWPIGLNKLRLKCGTTGDIYQFKYSLSELLKSGGIPEYSFALKPGKEGEIVVFQALKKRLLPDCSDTSLRLKLRSDTLDIARSLYPGYDIHYIMEEWHTWAQQKDEPIKDVNQAFLGFCKTYTKANPLP